MLFLSAGNASLLEADDQLCAAHEQKNSVPLIRQSHTRLSDVVLVRLTNCVKKFCCKALNSTGNQQWHLDVTTTTFVIIIAINIRRVEHYLRIFVCNDIG